MIHTLVLFAVVAVDQIAHKHNGSVPDDERTTNGATSALAAAVTVASVAVKATAQSDKVYYH